MTDSTPPENDDELELEPIDPEIIKHQQERTKRKVREAEDAVDINAVYDQENIGDPIDLEQLKQFRFTTRHMLIATAVLAMAATLFKRLGGCMGLFVSGCIALGAGWWFVLREEQRRVRELATRQQRLAERNAARRAIEDGEPLPASVAKQFEQDSAEPDPQDAAHFKFSFSMKELLITFTVAAVILGCMQMLGGAQNAALLLGFIALAGLLVQAFGAQLPPLIVLGWWLLLVMYILISLMAAFGPDPLAGASG